MKCKNCENSADENFCPHCGQRTIVDAINFGTLRNEFHNDIFQINRGFLFTIKELIVRPGHAIRDFVDGKRKPYYKPISFLLVSVTLYVFVAYLLDVDSFLARSINNFKDGWDNANQETDKFELPTGGIFEWLKTNQTYLVFVFVPIFSLASFIAFVRTKYNYYEHLVLQLYITGLQFIMITVFTCAFFAIPEILTITILVSCILYSLFTYKQFFKGRTFVEVFLRYILIQIIFIVLYFIISFVVVFVGIGIAKLM